MFTACGDDEFYGSPLFSYGHPASFHTFHFQNCYYCFQSCLFLESYDWRFSYVTFFYCILFHRDLSLASIFYKQKISTVM